MSEQASEQPRPNEAMLRIAGHVAKLGGWVVSVTDQVLTWSEETAAIHDEPPGFSPSVERALAYYALEDRERIRQALDECVTEGVPFDAELQIITAKGRRVWVRAIGEAVRNPAGLITSVQGAFQDISDQKLAAEEIKTLDARLHETLETLTDAFFTLDRDWRFTYVNREAERLLQRERAQLLGRNIWSEFKQAVGTASDHAYHRAMAEGITTRFKQFYPPLDRWLNAEAHPIREGLAVYFRDVTEQHRDTERHREQMESKCMALLEAAPDAMVLVSPDGTIVLVNQQAETQFGYRRDQLIGRAVTIIIPQILVGPLVADAERAVEQPPQLPAPTRIELAGRHQDGREFPIELTVNPLKRVEGILVTVAIRDITARKTTEAHLLRTLKELERSNQDLVQFAYLASHDLQEPLRMVSSYTHLLAKRYKGKLDADADEFIAFAVDGANRMQRLIQDLLIYSRVQTKGTTPQQTSSEDALNEAVGNLRGAIEESGALVTHDPLPAVLADDRQLVQLFQNLVGNAIKYRSAGVPRVHISSVDDGDTKRTFSVKDNGIGIESKYFEKIFGMFQRLHGRDEFAGTGIGLAICKKIVERHGGGISVESQPGQGSTFRFALAGNGRLA